MTEENEIRDDMPVVDPVVEETISVEEDTGKKCYGMDVGTNMLAVATLDSEGASVFRLQRDAYFRITPESEVNSNAIKLSLNKREADYFIDGDGSFIVIGDDALDIAIERRSIAERPLSQGVISPKSKNSLPIIKRIIKNLLGDIEEGSKVIFSIPGRPSDSSFDVIYHKEILTAYIESLGCEVEAINEGVALALSELLDDGLTGISISLGAGMINIVVMHEGSVIMEFSLTRSGDYIDTSVGTALDMSPSLVLMEKESGIDLYNPKGEIQDAICVYFDAVIKYAIKNIAYELEKNKKNLPIFKNGIPLVLGGGLALAKNFDKKFEECLGKSDFPIKITEVRIAENPMTACANGALLAAML